MDPRHPSYQESIGQQHKHQGHPSHQMPQVHAPLLPPSGHAAHIASPHHPGDSQTQLSPGPQNTPRGDGRINTMDPPEYRGCMSCTGCGDCIARPIQDAYAAHGQNAAAARTSFWSSCFCGSGADGGHTVAASKPEVVMGPPPVHETFGPFLRFAGYDPTSRQWRVSVLLVAHQTKCATAPSLRLKDKDAHTHSSEGTLTAVLVDQHQGWCFWRFNLEVELGPSQRALKYKVILPTDHHLTHHKKYLIVVPSATRSWHWGFYSCNGFHQPELEEKTKGIQPLWRDVLYVHEQNPIHMMVGGGDQLYNDGVWQSPSLKTWVKMPDVDQKYAHPFSQEMMKEVTDFYFHHYLHQWNQAAFKDALAMIPQAMIWDDHDIFDGWGSYPTELQNCHVFQGIYQVARKFYTLFQQHSTPERMHKDNGVFGVHGWHTLTCLGPSTALLLMDNRSERSLERIMKPESYEEIKTRILDLPAAVQHVLVVSAVPMVYPKLPVVEAAFKFLSGGRSSIVAMLQKTGLADSIVGEFGTVEIQDDLQDHWGADTHEKEKHEFVQLMQQLALKRSFRFTILSGDVHVAGVGRFLSEPKHDLKTDHRYIPQIISSAIGNIPPPDGVVMALTTFATPKMLDPDTKETMVNIFGDKPLCPARNWLVVGEVPYNNGATEIVPGSINYQFRVETGQMGSNQRPETYEIQVPPLELAPGTVPPVMPSAKPIADHVHGLNAAHGLTQGNTSAAHWNAPAGAHSNPPHNQATHNGHNEHGHHGGNGY